MILLMYRVLVHHMLKNTRPRVRFAMEKKRSRNAEGGLNWIAI